MEAEIARGFQKPRVPRGDAWAEQKNALLRNMGFLKGYKCPNLEKNYSIIFLKQKQTNICTSLQVCTVQYSICTINLYGNAKEM